jgi:hypothetical protein
MKDSSRTRSALLKARLKKRPDYYEVAPSRMHNFSLVYNHVFSLRFVSQTLAGVNYFKQVFIDANSGFDIPALVPPASQPNYVYWFNPAVSHFLPRVLTPTSRAMSSMVGRLARSISPSSRPPISLSA